MQSKKSLVAISLMVATFLTAIEGTVVSTAMPKIASELQGIERMNWVFSIYLLTSAVTVPIFGKLSDLFGRKIIFYIGTFIFLVGSALCGLSQSMDMLIVYRAIQGIGAGAIMPMSTTIIGDVFPVAERAKMFGFISLIWGISGIAGPLVGGFFVDQLTWEWIFFFNIPFGILAVIMLGYSFHEKVDKTAKKIDYMGAITFSIAMVSLLYALQLGGEGMDWTSPTLLLLFGLFILFTLIFIWVETKAKEPMIPLQLFRNRIISVVNGTSLFTSAVLIGIMVYIPMWIQGVLGQGATLSGLVLMPMSITWTVGSFLVGRLIAKRGARTIISAALLVLLIGTISLAMFDESQSIIMLYIISALTGIGFGLFTAYSTILVQTSVDWSLRGVSTSSNVFFRTLGQTVGVAVLGTFFNAKVSKQLALQDTSHLTMDQLNKLVNPATATELSETTIVALREVLVSGVHHVYIILAVLIGISLVASVLLPKINMATEIQKE